MRRLPIPDWVLDVAYVTAASMAGTIILARATQTGVYQRAAAAGIPILSPVLRGVDSLTHQVVNK